KTPPRDMLEARVQPGDFPHVSLHRTEKCGAVVEKGMSRKKHQGTPRIFEGNADVVHGIRASRAAPALSFDLLRPLPGALAERRGQWMLVGRRDRTHKNPLLCPRRIQVFNVANPIRENHSLSGAIE